MSTPAIPRHAAGTRQGGQFAAYRQDHQHGSLEPGTDEWYDADQEAALAAVFDADFMDDLQQAVGIAARKYPAYADDLLGETYEAIHVQVARAHESRRPLTLAEAANRRSFLASVAARRGQTLATGLDRGNDVAAWREFTGRRTTLENRMGRPLTGAEREALAEEVRLSITPHSRPGNQYWRAVGESNITAPGGGQFRSRGVDEAQVTALTPEERAAGWSDGLRASPVMEEMIRIKKAGGVADGTVKRGTAERMVYTLAAVEHGAPLPAEGGVTEKTWYRKHKKALAAAGGVEQAITAYQAGTCAPDTEAALFAPVTPPGSVLTRREKHAVCDALCHFPGGAEKTYQALVNTVLQHEADAQRAVAERG